MTEKQVVDVTTVGLDTPHQAPSQSKDIGPYPFSISIPCQLVRNAESQPHPGRIRLCILTNLRVIHMHSKI